MGRKKWVTHVALAVAIVGLLLIGSLWVLRRHGRADIAQEPVDRSIMMGSTSFASGTTMAKKLTCDGDGLSPEIHWSEPPPGTRSLAIVMDDRDAPFGFVHWLAYGIPAGDRGISEGAHSRLEGTNSADTVGYTGPCPPGKGAHHYLFRLYALNVELDLPRGQTKQQLAAEVKGHVLAEGQLLGLYRRESR